MNEQNPSAEKSEGDTFLNIQSRASIDNAKKHVHKAQYEDGILTRFCDICDRYITDDIHIKPTQEEKDMINRSMAIPERVLNPNYQK